MLLASLATADGTQNLSSDTLRNDQLAVSGRYDRFERLLSQMADILGHDDPDRAELLRRAISQGREKAISNQLGQIASDLGQNNLGKALEQQEEVLESLAVLLQLLQSEDRRSELEKERERLNELLKDVANTLSQQKSARASTQNSTAPSSSAPHQQNAIDRADRILDDINAHDDPKDAAENSQDPTDAGDQSSEASPSDDNQTTPTSDGDNTTPGEDDPKNTSTQKSDSDESPSQQSESQDSGSQDSPSQSGNSESENKQTPGRDQVANARRYMQEALEQLQEQLRDEALKKQDGAIEELQKAIDELRKQLLQLREEEKEMILASLEARFQRMLAGQIQILDETLDLNTTPVDDWLDTMLERSRQIAQQQAELTGECEQTLGLLKEDGTSVAIVLSVEDISTDMKTAADRLRQSKVGSLTQALETDVIEALKELIEATQREMQDMKSEERQQQAQNGEQKKPPLVQLIAEIKVLRSLQLRLNRRTQRIDEFMAEQTADDRDHLIEQLEQLTTRQQRLVESAQELSKRMSR